MIINHIQIFIIDCSKEFDKYFFVLFLYFVKAITCILNDMKKSDIY